MHASWSVLVFACWVVLVLWVFVLLGFGCAYCRMRRQRSLRRRLVLRLPTKTYRSALGGGRGRPSLNAAAGVGGAAESANPGAYAPLPAVDVGDVEAASGVGAGGSGDDGSNPCRRRTGHIGHRVYFSHGPLSKNTPGVFAMRSRHLIVRGLTYYWRTHVAVVIGVATAVAVLVLGAILIKVTRQVRPAD
jgi:hypothetical protein